MVVQDVDPGGREEDEIGHKRRREEGEPSARADARPGVASPGLASELELLFTAGGVREHEFDCPVPGCDGKLTISADVCRFGHGAVAACRAPAGCASAEGPSVRTSHTCKWCPVTYAFTPAALWGEHMSCFSGSSAPPSACADVTELQPRIAELRASDAEDSAALAHGKVASTGSERRKSAKGASDVEALRVQIADGFDETLIDIVAQELTKHRHAILCGETESSKWWNDRLRQLQRETVISGLQARAFPKAPANAPLDPEIEEEKARNSAFMYRVAAGDVAGVRKLMQQESFSLETHDGFSNSPLHWAAATGCTAICRALVDGGFDVGARGNDGHTPLHIAAMHGRYAVVELLVARGANWDEENDEGLTPRHLFNLFFQSHTSANQLNVPTAARIS